MNPIWFTVIASILGGGAMGAIITTVVNHRRNRIQPVGYTQEIIHIFRKGQDFPTFAELLVSDHPLSFENQPVENLSLARITVTNTGSQDIEEFSFGVTMEGSYKVVGVKMKQPDRHHTMKTYLRKHGHE